MRRQSFNHLHRHNLQQVNKFLVLHHQPPVLCQTLKTTSKDSSMIQSQKPAKQFTKKSQLLQFGKLTTNFTAKRSNFVINCKAQWLQWTEQLQPAKSCHSKTRQICRDSTHPYRGNVAKADVSDASTQPPSAISRKSRTVLRNFPFRLRFLKSQSGNVKKMNRKFNVSPLK